ncbi:MAG: phage tail protein [Bacteroidota bacterium]
MPYDLLSILPPGAPPMSHKFGVFYFRYGVLPSFVDLRFQKISGIGTSLELETITEGGNVFHEHRLPKQVKYENLVLERGYTTSGSIATTFDKMMNDFSFYTGTCIVTLFGESGLPISAWKFSKVFPVKWSLSDLDGASNQVLVNTMELAYTRWSQISIT